jgi:FMN phosphatase YigB (HAD superfamily)
VGSVAVVSNFDDTASAYAILARHGLLERVDAVVISEAVGRRKPHPLPIVAALRSLDVAASDAVFIGDGATADVGAARAAGVTAVLIAPGGNEPPGTADVVVARLADVPRALGW